MTEFILPVDNPKTREAQRVLGFSPTDLAQVALQNAWDGEPLSTKTSGSFVMRLSGANRGVVVRYFPSNVYKSHEGETPYVGIVPTDLVELADHVIWQEEELARIEEEGIGVPPHFSLVMAGAGILTAIGYTKGRNLKMLYGDPDPAAQHILLEHNRRFLGYLKQDRPSYVPPMHDIYGGHQSIRLSLSKTALIDTDPLKAYSSAHELPVLAAEVLRMTYSSQREELHDEIVQTQFAHTYKIRTEQ